ncbi:MAG: hypothetical protein IPN79_12995 [Saprospiraceae bacterium]|nr:hypothetical protein [Saprospiraceae bacterium]
MIVPSMTYEEIHIEMIRDAKDFLIKIFTYHKQFDREVLKTSRFPVIRSYDFVTKERKNKYNVTFKAKKRSHRRNPAITFYTVFDRPEGKYAVCTADLKSVFIYTPHFFKRYRERILKDDTISNKNLIKLFFRNDWGFRATTVDKNFEEVYHSFEDSTPNEKVCFVAALANGYCFGEYQGTVSVLKTIISEEMLFEKQKKIFKTLQNTLHEENVERFGKILYPYLSMSG